MAKRECPDKAVLILKGETFRCDWMDSMSENSEGHDGWAHSNVEAQAVWNG